jgi:hypothetical protein
MPAATACARARPTGGSRRLRILFSIATSNSSLISAVRLPDQREGKRLKKI